MAARRDGLVGTGNVTAAEWVIELAASTRPARRHGRPHGTTLADERLVSRVMNGLDIVMTARAGSASDQRRLVTSPDDLPIDPTFLPASTAELLRVPRRGGERLSHAINRALQIAALETQLTRRGWSSTHADAPSGGTARTRPRGPSGSHGLTTANAWRGFTFFLANGRQYTHGGGLVPRTQRPRANGVVAGVGWTAEDPQCGCPSGDAGGLNGRAAGGARGFSPGRRHAAASSPRSGRTGQAGFQLTAQLEPLADLPPEDFENNPPVPVAGAIPDSVGEFRSDSPGADVGHGTGNVVGPAHVMTAAHVLWDDANNRPMLWCEEGGISDWNVDFVPAKTPSSGTRVEVICAGYDSRWLEGRNVHGFLDRDVDDFDLGIALLMENETTAFTEYQRFFAGFSEADYDGRTMGLYGYPRDGVELLTGALHVSLGAFRRFASADLAEYGCQHRHGQSGGRVSAYPNGTGAGAALYLMSFLHIGGIQVGDEYSRGHGIRFSEEKAQSVVDAICSTPGSLVDLSADCS